eukprot:6344325-Alexandrium_andersonii.AAC.1
MNASPKSATAWAPCHESWEESKTNASARAHAPMRVRANPRALRASGLRASRLANQSHRLMGNHML